MVPRTRHAADGVFAARQRLAPLRTHPVLKKLAARLGATPARIALAWLLRQPDVVAIPKASSEAHVRDNHAALELALSADDLAELDRTFPPPKARDAARDDLSACARTYARRRRRQLERAFVW